MSPDGHCRAFDVKARGTVYGSGAGIVVLKPLANAIKDGDSVHAIIKGSAINNDGSMKVGYTAPSVEGQAQVITEALEVAGVDPETISYVEAHGTGTPIGDPIEIVALTQAFRTRTTKKAFCGIGSLKTNIGHLDTAAGVAGFIKTVLALKNQELPPSLHYEAPNPEIDFANSPFFVNAKLSKWNANGSPRRAGVSSLGVGGTNAHVILEEAFDQGPCSESRPWQLLLQSARSDDALNRATVNLAKYLEQNPDLNLADVAYTLQVGRRGFNRRRMLVCRDRDDAISALESLDPQRVFTQGKADGDRSVLFMFPGGGAQYVNMGLGLYQDEPTFHKHVEECLELLKARQGVDLRRVLYPGDEMSEEASKLLEKPSLGLPALFTIEYALAKLWMSWGLEPAAMIGHSMGEYTAACLAGVIPLENALALVALRGRLFEKLPEGAMLSVPLSEGDAQAFTGDGLSIAAINGPSLCVVSGETAGIDHMEKALAAKGIQSTRLHISVAAHSKLVEPILGEFGQFLKTLDFQEPRIPYVSNVTGRWITAGEVKDPAYWVRHLRQTVRFSDGLQDLLRMPGRILLEVGPGQTLSTFARQQSTGAPPSAHALSSLRHPKDSQSDTALLLNTLGQLWLAGVRINWSGFYAGEQRRRVSLPTYPFEHRRYWIDPGKQAHAITSLHGSLKKKPDIADWFYLPTWKETVLSAPWEPNDLKGETAGWLVFANECGFSSRLVERLASQRDSLEGKGHGVTTVVPGKQFRKLSDGVYSLNPNEPTDYDALLAELAQAGRFPQKIAHLWNITPLEPIESATEDLETGLDLSFYSLLYLAQALGRQNLTESVHIGVVANGMQQVAGEAVPHPEKATLLGPSKVIPHEFPNITCKTIDITLPEPGSWQEERLLNQLISELSADFSSAVVAYRGHQRWVQTFVPLRLDQAVAAKRPPLRQGGTYLITGGLGGIALALAEHLAKTVQANLVLVSRHGLPPRNAWAKWLASHDHQEKTSVRIRKVQGLEQFGAAVFIATADVANASQMRKVVDQAKDHFGGIHGVIHAAGLINDSIIQLKSREAVDQVLAPKIKGTLVLDAVLRDEKLDMFVLFSSISAISGPAGQADYAAANAFLDAFAQQKAVKDATYTVAINWGVWREVGIVAEAAARAGVSDGVVFKPAGKEVTHPLLGKCIVDSADEIVYSTELTDRHWVVDEHRFKSGEAVFPGTASLEMARAALEQNSQHRAVEIRNLLFLEPLVLRAGEHRELRIALKRRGDSFEFVVSSRSGSGQTRAHARGTIGYIDPPHAKSRSIAEIEARCAISERAFNGVEQHAYVDFGPRWKNIKRVRFGSQEALVAIELPEAFTADLEQYTLHPAILDMATGGAHALIRGYDRLKDFYVPLSYGKVRVNAPLPAKLFSHIKVREQDGTQNGIAVFDITILDENGLEIVEISDFVVRKITDVAKMTGQENGAAETRADVQGSGEDRVQRAAISQALLTGLEEGIMPVEGVDAFCRILSSGLSPRIIVASQDVNALIDAAKAGGMAGDANRTGQAQSAVLQHSRPELLTTFVPPATELERKIAGIWQESLGIQQIGIHDDFFELGGHSLMIVTIHSKLQQALDITFPVAKMFQHPTISSLATYLREGQGGKPSYGESP